MGKIIDEDFASHQKQSASRFTYTINAKDERLIVGSMKELLDTSILPKNIVSMIFHIKNTKMREELSIKFSKYDVTSDISQVIITSEKDEKILKVEKDLRYLFVEYKTNYHWLYLTSYSFIIFLIGSCVIAAYSINNVLRWLFSIPDDYLFFGELIGFIVLLLPLAFVYAYIFPRFLFNYPSRKTSRNILVGVTSTVLFGLLISFIWAIIQPFIPIKWVRH